MRGYSWSNNLKKIKCTPNSDACHLIFSVDFKSKQGALPGKMLEKYLKNQNKTIFRTNRRYFPVNNHDS